MGKASISIAISGSYNGSAVERAEKSLDRLAVKTAAAESSMSKSWVEAGSRAAELGGKIYNLGESMEQAGSTLTGALTLPLAAAGAAAVTAATDFEAAGSKIDAACGSATASAEALKDVGRDLYTQGWGDSMDSLSTSLIRAREILGDLSETDMSYAVEGAMTLEKAYGSDFSESLRGVNVLMDKFGLSATEATDLMVSGTQRGLDYTKELGDNLSEYSGRWADAGISASQYFSLLEAGAQGGAYQLDKVGDFLNEFLTSLTDGRMEDGIGRFSEGTQATFEAFKAGGASAQDVLNSVVGELASMPDEYAKAQIASELWSSLGEDNAMSMITALAGVDDTFTNVAGAAQDAGDKISDNLANKATSALRTAQEAAEPFASVAVDMLGDAADAAKGAAEGFSDLDEGTQSMIVSAGLLAAAAGPVLTVGGRIVKGAGSVVTAYGRARQEIGVYADALTTTNAASLKAYQGNEKLAKALERNPAVKAAGGVQQYVDAVTTANRENAAYESSVRKLTNEQKKGSKANSEIIASLEKEVSERKSAAAAAKGTVDGYKASAAAAKTSTVAVTAQSVAMKAASVAATGLKIALGTIAPIAVIAGITAIADAFMKAKEHEDLLADATVSASDIMSGAAGAADGLGDAIGGIATDSEETLKALSELNSSVSDTLGDVTVDSAKLDQYLGVINELANQTGLTATEQYRLTEAVSGYNEVTGESYSVVDAANGKIADQNGVLQDNTDKLNESADAWKRRAQSEALSNVATQYLEQEAQAAYDLQIAQDNLNATKERAAELSNIASGATGASADEMARAGMEADELYRKIPGLEQEVNDLAAAHETAAQSAEDFSSAAAIQSAVFATLGDDAMDFTAQLGETGLGLEAFAGLTDDQLSGIASRWDGTTDSIFAAMSELQIGIPAAGWSSMLGLDTALNDGGADVINTALGVSGMTAQQFADKVGEYGLSGNASIIAFANAIAAGDTYDVAAKKAADGVSGLSSQNGSAYSAGSGLAASANSGMSSIDTWTSGLHLGSNFASGIRAAYSTVVSAASAVASAAASSLQFSVPKSGPWSGSEKGGVTSGMHLAQNFAKGMLAGTPDVSAAARAVAGSAALSGSSRYHSTSISAQAPAQSRDEVSMLLVELIEEVSALRQELGPTIANYAPQFPTERQQKRRVQEWTR